MVVARNNPAYKRFCSLFVVVVIFQYYNTFLSLKDTIVFLYLHKMGHTHIQVHKNVVFEKNNEKIKLG